MQLASDVAVEVPMAACNDDTDWNIVYIRRWSHVPSTVGRINLVQKALLRVIHIERLPVRRAND